jgi:methyl-accepting chemotaxis protein
MSSNIKASAENAQKANQLSRKASEEAEQGGIVVNKTIGQMRAVSESSKKIANIINVVNEIAFQTNLLALNAAVEAARAGEQGRGFAVVAGEVRNLAGRSAEAAKEIQSLIKDSVEKIDAGNKLVEETGDTLKKIIVSVKEVGQTVSEISSASQEQSSGIDQVNKAISLIDEVVQQNASLVEEAAATSENLSGEAADLRKLTASFKINNGNLSKHNRDDNRHKQNEKTENAASYRYVYNKETRK